MIVICSQLYIFLQKTNNFLRNIVSENYDNNLFKAKKKESYLA